MNKSRYIKLIIGILTIVTLLVVIPILGSESDYKGETLETLEKRVLESNLDVKRAKENLMIAEYKEEEADDMKGTGGSTPVETRKLMDYYPLEADMNVAYAEWDLEDTKEKKTLEGIESYFDYQFLLSEIKIQQNKISRLETELASVNKKIELGTMTVNDRITAELNVSKASYDLQILINDRDRLFLDLNVLMKYDLDTQLVLEYEAIPFEAYVTENINNDVANVISKNGDLEKLEYQNRLAIKELNIYEDNNASDQYDRTITTVKEKGSNYNMDISDKKQSLEYDVRSMYNDLLSSYDSFIVKELELENLKLTLDVKTKRFEVGLETGATVDLAKENLDFAQLAYEKAQLDYYVSVETYKNFIN